jgi:hypothetical protein
MLQQNDGWKALFNRLLDYRIIHSCASAITHKSQPGNYRAFSIDIGCYAHLRKLQGRFVEIDVSSVHAKEQIRSAQILDESKLAAVFNSAPEDIERHSIEQDEDAAQG